VEHYFASLSKRQTMLLLASVVFGGAWADEAFQFLPEEEAELLKHRSGAFRAIPKEQRIPFLVQKMRRMLSMRRKRLATADPKHLAELLSKEKPVVAEVVLRTLPSALAHSVQAALPGFQETQMHREPRAEVLSIVRWKLEEKLQNASVSAHFRFEDVMGLQPGELITVCDRMGVRVFATALAGLPSGERQNFFDVLPPDQRMLAQKACEAAGTRHLQANDARRLLELYGAMESPSSAIRSAGARRIIKACLAESVDFASKMTRRYEGELGKLLANWFEKEKEKKIRADGGKEDLLEQLEFLAKRGFLERPFILPSPEVSIAQLPGQKRLAPSSSLGMASARLPAPPNIKPSRLSARKLPEPTPSKLVRPGSQRENVAAVSQPRSHPNRLPKPQIPERLGSSPPPQAASAKQLALPPSEVRAKRLPPPSSSQAASAKQLAVPPSEVRVKRLLPPPSSQAASAKQLAVPPSEVRAKRLPPPPPSKTKVQDVTVTASTERPVLPLPSFRTTGQHETAGKSSVARMPAHKEERTDHKGFTDKSAVARVSAHKEERTDHKGFIGKSSVVRVPALQSVPRKRTAEGVGSIRQEGDNATQGYRVQKDIGEKPNRKS